MTAYINSLGLTYYSTPKVACTSLKSTVFEIENGFQFKAFSTNGVRRHIHSFYPSMPFHKAKDLDKAENFRFGVVRDPIERLLSAYRNRVLQHDELSERALHSKDSSLKLVPRPTLDQFLERLEDYRSVSASVAHHTAPQTFFLGMDAKYFDCVFQIEELHKVSEFLSERCGRRIAIPHQQRGGQPIPRSDLSQAQIARLRLFYEVDYKSFGGIGSFK